MSENKTQKFNFQTERWEDIEFKDLRKGDVYRSFTPDGNLITAKVDTRFHDGIDGKGTIPVSWKESGVYQAQDNPAQDMYGNWFIGCKLIFGNEDVEVYEDDTNSN